MLERSTATDSAPVEESLPIASFQRVLEWGRGPRPEPELPRRVHELFAEQVRRTPDRTAVSDADGSLTYAEVNANANRLARHLLAEGVGAGHLVAVAMEQRPSLVAALLAVWKAGAAYLPLNPTDPPERIARILDDAAPSFLLTSPATEAVISLRPPNGRCTPDSASVRDMLARLSPSDVDTPGNDRYLAYVIFTSGSTGRPKGVAIEHRSLRIYLRHALAAYPGLDRSSVVHSPVSFDLTVTGLYGPLLAGGQVTLAAGLGDGHPGRPDFFKCTPAHLPILSSLPPHSSPGASLVFGGGELLWELLDPWREAHPGTTVFNEYGPTETTVGCTIRRIAPGQVSERGSVTIGRAMPGTRLYVLDTALRPVPPWQPGELYIAGDLLARGYFDDPSATARHFVPDPFGPPGARMYRTGDMFLWRDDGELRFCGRSDDQVKIRGYRVELGEVEAALCAHPSVGSAVALAEAVGAGDHQLVGYAVCDAGEPVSPERLRDWVAARLPGYMVPHTIRLLDAIPLTTNGKVDRARLPRLLPRTGGDEPSRGSGSPGSKVLCGLFGQVLGVEQVGEDDNFFALGGSSLTAMQLVTRVQKTFGLSIELDDVFRQKTPARMARHLTGGPSLPALHAAPAMTRTPLSHAQQRLWYLARLHGTTAPYHMWRTSRLYGPLDVTALRGAVADTMRRHEVLRTAIRSERGVPYPHLLPLTADDGLQVLAGGPDPERRLRELLARPFDLAHALPFRAHLLPTGPEEHLLALVAHHGAADDISLSTLQRDLGAAYAARVRGTAPQWASLPLRYGDFALWQQEQTTGTGALVSQLASWVAVLAGAPAESLPPTDFPRSAGATAPACGVATAELPPAAHQGLLEFAARTEITLFMTLHMALLLALRGSGAPSELVIGTPSSGRFDEQLADVVGCFLNSLPLRTDLGDDPTVSGLAEHVRATDLAAFSHQHVPFEQIVEALRPERAAGRHPLFQVMFSFMDSPGDVLDLAGVEVTPVRVEPWVAKFDLTLEMRERRGPSGTAEGIECQLEYSKDLFEPATVRAIAQRLEQACLLLPNSGPDTGIGELVARLQG